MDEDMQVFTNNDEDFDAMIEQLEKLFESEDGADKDE